LASVFKRQQWGRGERITTTKLNDMVANDDWLFQNMITGYYDALGVARDSGLSIRAGYIKGVPTENKGWSLATYYARPFLPGARPVVVVGMATTYDPGIWKAVYGLDRRAVPDHRGFMLYTFQHDRTPGGPSRYLGDQYYSYISIAGTG
jgi:hypothetical protein